MSNDTVTVTIICERVFINGKVVPTEFYKVDEKGCLTFLKHISEVFPEMKPLFDEKGKTKEKPGPDDYPVYWVVVEYEYRP